jgi:hypothetical protein
MKTDQKQQRRRHKSVRQIVLFQEGEIPQKDVDKVSRVCYKTKTCQLNYLFLQYIVTILEDFKRK